MTSDTRLVADRYRLQHMLGRGGMGAVWQAWDTQLEREVAIKEVLVPDSFSLRERTEAHNRTRREARSAARLRHPSVITIHDVFEDDGHPWIVMELIGGRSLDSELKEHGPLPLARVQAIGAALLDALQAAHAGGVVHRDIKPGNVMLAADGRVILTDFGIATIEGETSITASGALVGSPHYMAPERLRQDSSEAPSDVWSLGATLFAMVEGRSPFKRETVPASISAALSEPVPRPERAGPLAPVILGMLDRDAQRRITAAQAAQFLATSAPTAPVVPGAEQAGEAAGESALPPHTPPERKGPGDAKRTVFAAAAAGAVVLLLVAGGAVWLAPRPLDAEYRLYATDYYAFEHPVDWSTDTGENGLVTVSHPNALEEISFSANSYVPDEDDPVDELERMLEDRQPSEEFDGYEQSVLGPVDSGYLPEGWSAALLEYQLRDSDSDHPARYRIRYQLHAEYSWSLTAVWLSWDLPEDQHSNHRQIIDHVNRSARPQNR